MLEGRSQIESVVVSLLFELQQNPTKYINTKSKLFAFQGTWFKGQNGSLWTGGIEHSKVHCKRD